MASVELIGIKKRFGAVPVLHGVDLRVANGEFLVLVGPSGCGKSTILRLIAGLETLDAGEIRIGERVVNPLEPRERNVAMVFQNYALYPHMSVFKNMAYGLKVRKTPKAEILQRVTEAAQLLGIEEYLNRKPRQLSGGQRQRVAMGRAIVREPSVFLLDEPLSNLDARLRTQMRVELKRLHHKLGNTFIYVTHDQVEAMTLGDRILVMHAGQVEQIGTPAEIYNHPQTVFTAEFIGSPPMNLLKGCIANEGRSVRLAGGQEVCCDHPIPVPDGEVIIGIRPEDLAIAHSNPSHQDTLTVSVDLLESLGASTVLYCKIQPSETPGGAPLRSANASTGESLVLKLNGNTHYSMGDRLTVRLNCARLHFFDPRSGQRVEPEVNQ